MLGAVTSGPLARAEGPARFAWEILPARELHPAGWLKRQWAEDFAEGLPGRLDTINQDVAQNVFAAQGREIALTGRPTWWPGEQEAYWHEAYIHAAFQLGDVRAIARATEYVEAVLRSQTPEGYLGIYAAGSRLLPPDDPRYGEGGGELHTQAHLLLALLAFHEQTGRRDVLQAVEKAAQLTMRSYPAGGFGTAGARTAKAGGNSHAVTFNDALMQLYRLTGDERYWRYVGTHYASYAAHPPRDRDLTPATLENPEARFVGHGAHTAESFHWPAALALGGDPAAERRAQAAMEKLARQLTPGGALISDEMIDGRLGNGRDLYEYCTQAELIKSLTWIAQYRGDTVAAERAARLYLNASMGARLHPLGALQYLSRDDRLDIPTRDKKDASNIKNDGSHFQLSSIIRPTCCPASAGRPVHYYLASAWMKRPDGGALALMNLMPCEVATEVAGVPVRIAERTDYPFADAVRLEIAVPRPVEFPLAIRMPLEGELTVRGVPAAAHEKRDGFLWLRREWKDGDIVELALNLPVVRERTRAGDAEYYRRGSLTFALPFATAVKPVKENPDWRTQAPGGLFEYDARVADKTRWGLRLAADAAFMPVSLPGDPQRPWTSPTLGLRGAMLDAQGRKVEVTLVPEGAALSRRVTFLDHTHPAEEAAQLPVESAVSLGL